MNNEINNIPKEWQDILNKYNSYGNIVNKDAMKAISEIVELEKGKWESLQSTKVIQDLQQQLAAKDKQVDGKIQRATDALHKKIEGYELALSTEEKYFAEILTKKDKEIELLKKELFKANEDYDKDFEKIKKLERVIRKMDADAVTLEKEIAEMSAFVNPLKEGWKDEF